MPAAAPQPRILLITRNFPPLTGGMERLIHRAADGLGQWCELDIIGPAGCAEHAPPGSKVREAPSSMAGFLAVAIWHVLLSCRPGKYQVLIGGSGLTAPVLWIARLFCRCPAAVFVHGLDIVVDSPIYQRVFVPAIRSMNLLIANSANTQRLAELKGIEPKRISVINPGTDLPELETIEARESFMARKGIEYDRIILFVGRMTRRKGLSEFIRLSLKAIVESTPGTGLVVIGSDPVNSLNQLGEEADVLRAVEETGLGSSITFLGAVDDRDLLAGYAAADVQIFPLLDIPGDVEGFGMVAIEAAACGTPTVAFACGGVGDAISADNGALVPAGDHEQFSRTVTEALAQTRGPERCKAHAGKFSWPRFHAELTRAIQSLLAAR